MLFVTTSLTGSHSIRDKLMIQIRLLGKSIECNWVSFITLCHHQNANQLCQCQCQICCQSLSQFRYPSQTHPRFRPIDITFVQTVQSCELQPLSSCKTLGLFTHSQPSAINSNLHNTSHNEAPRSRLVFSTCFDDVFHSNTGDIPNGTAHVVNTGCVTPD